MITSAHAAEVAAEWIAAWNAHDLERVLAHYTDDFEMSSPFIASIAGEPSGVLRGKPAIRAYWAKALQLVPDLRFTPVAVLTGANSVAIHYTNQRGGHVVEVLAFGAGGLVARAAAHYA